jgi:hypothetical protein
VVTPPWNPLEQYSLAQAKAPKLPRARRKFSNEDLRGARFSDSDLSGSRFQEVNFRYARLHGVDFVNAHIWGATSGLIVNGVEIGPLIEAELERRYPGRAALFASDLDGVRSAWGFVEKLWESTTKRAQRLGDAALHSRVDEEWSFLETLRHLVLVDDGFLRQVQDRTRPIYVHGVPHTPMRQMFVSVIDLDAEPSADQVLGDRQERMAAVRNYLQAVDDVELNRVCKKLPRDVHGRDAPVLRCFWRMVNEEWEHHTFATRDLATLERDGVQ